MGTLGLTISGGEAFAHPDLLPILREAQKRDFSITLLTNLTLLRPEHISELQALNLNLIQTSLYSTVSEEHDHITKLVGSHAKTVRAIDWLIAADIPVQISCPVMKTNLHSYKEVLRFAQDRRCKAQTDFIMMARFDYSTDNLSERLDLGETEALLRDITQFDADYGDLTEFPIQPKPPEEIAKEIVCGVGRDSLCIAANGIAYPCSGWQGMAVGDVRRQSIREIWENSPQLIELRGITKGSFPGCLTCEDKQFCAMCMVRNFNESGGDILKINDHFCKAAAINRKLVEEHRAKAKAI
jgi:radical SAM protein with 4Fe4S-binding SPASM domain